MWIFPKKEIKGVDYDISISICDVSGDFNISDHADCGYDFE